MEPMEPINLRQDDISNTIIDLIHVDANNSTQDIQLPGFDTLSLVPTIALPTVEYPRAADPKTTGSHSPVMYGLNGAVMRKVSHNSMFKQWAQDLASAGPLLDLRVEQMHRHQERGIALPIPCVRCRLLGGIYDQCVMSPDNLVDILIHMRLTPTMLLPVTAPRENDNCPCVSCKVLSGMPFHTPTGQMLQPDAEAAAHVPQLLLFAKSLILQLMKLGWTTAPAAGTLQKLALALALAVGQQEWKRLNLMKRYKELIGTWLEREMMQIWSIKKREEHLHPFVRHEELQAGKEDAVARLDAAAGKHRELMALRVEMEALSTKATKTQIIFMVLQMLAKNLSGT
ncbi:hypothetical protein MKZ38_004666 [Zalerion maritima]|uniref:Uncharacterized protein n=1 Tax=Zalerion maritima TaxID=339359 RepID=A0AAD5RLD0_9PEZI|nr:hypothetical protein MKZ38_004666 [Zalerion maritima]